MRTAVTLAFGALLLAACSSNSPSRPAPTPEVILKFAPPNPTATPYPTPTPTHSAVGPAWWVRLDGAGPGQMQDIPLLGSGPLPTRRPQNTQSTGAFTLSGLYRVVITGKSSTPPSGGSLSWGSVAASLKRGGGTGDAMPLFDEVVAIDSGGTYEYETRRRLNGTYYLELSIPPGAWEVTFTPEG